MSDYCVVVTGGACARFFTLEPVEFPELESGPRLIECGELYNPEKRIPARNLYTDSKTGRHRASRGGPAHGYDDHRSQHEDEFDRRFAHEVMEKKHVSCSSQAGPVHSSGSTRPYSRIASPRTAKHCQTWHACTQIGQGYDQVFFQKDPRPSCQRARAPAV